MKVLRDRSRGTSTLFVCFLEAQEAVGLYTQPDKDWRRDIDRRIGADERAEQDRERKSRNHIRAEYQQHCQRQHDRHGRNDCPRQRLVQRQVDQRDDVHLAELAQIFPDSVVDHDRVVKRIANHGEEGCDDIEIDLELLEKREEAEDQTDVVEQRR